jgi:FkbM family methyltransferase
VSLRKKTGAEPRIPVQRKLELAYFGKNHCGWSIPLRVLGPDSVILDAGLGEDMSFSTAIADFYGCRIQGFDPTPRAIAFVNQLNHPSITLHPYGVAAETGEVTFYMPDNPNHVSGSEIKANHVGEKTIQVNMLSLEDAMTRIGRDELDLLKIDIEGSEYKLLASPDFERYAPRIKLICIEFHHRWANFGPKATISAVETLNKLGFDCCWSASTTNEEFLFVNRNLVI